MAKSHSRFGGQPARYRCFLNPYTSTRCTKCPRCEKPTYPRKFPLVIAVEGTVAPVVLGLTCKYCSMCELIVAHKDVVEHQLLRLFREIQPEVIGNEFFVVATMEMAEWTRIKDLSLPVAEVTPLFADIKEHLFYEYRME